MKHVAQGRTQGLKSYNTAIAAMVLIARAPSRIALSMTSVPLF